jgi:hypothetical protein
MIASQTPPATKKRSFESEKVTSPLSYTFPRAEHGRHQRLHPIEIAHDERYVAQTAYHLRPPDVAASTAWHYGRTNLNAADRSFLRALDLDRCPHLFEGSLDPLGLLPSHALFDDLWRALDKIFRFLQPEAREESDFPEDFDLHPAGGLENNRKLAFFRRLSDLRHRRAIAQMATDGPHARQSIPGRA